MLDPALDTLLCPSLTGALSWPAARAISCSCERAWRRLRARATALICRAAPRCPGAVPGRVPLNSDAGDAARSLPLILCLPPRQREGRFILAEAVACAGTGGLVVASVANNEGRGRSSRSRSARRQRRVLSKNKCRVFWARINPARIDQALLADWLALGQPRRIADARFLSRPGLCLDRIDTGSALSPASCPADLAGHGADLGAGFGYLSAESPGALPAVTALDLL